MLPLRARCQHTTDTSRAERRAPPAVCNVVDGDTAGIDVGRGDLGEVEPQRDECGRGEVGGVAISALPERVLAPVEGGQRICECFSH